MHHRQTAPARRVGVPIRNAQIVVVFGLFGAFDLRNFQAKSGNAVEQRAGFIAGC